jgi:hypothetical protein
MTDRETTPVMPCTSPRDEGGCRPGTPPHDDSDTLLHATSRLSGVARPKGDTLLHATSRLSGVARPKAVNDTYDAATTVEETAPAGVADDVPENSTGRAAKRPRDEDP